MLCGLQTTDVVELIERDVPQRPELCALDFSVSPGVAGLFRPQGTVQRGEVETGTKARDRLGNLRDESLITKTTHRLEGLE